VAARALAVWTVVAAAGCGRLAFDPSGDGGTSGDDGSSTSDGSDASGPSCAGFDVCDGFEGALGANWTTLSTVSVDTAQAHRGTRSMRFQSPALLTNQSAYINLIDSTTIGAFTPTTVYMRSWFFLDSLPAAANRMYLISTEPSAGGNGDFLFAFSNDTDVFSQYENQSQTSGFPFPTDTWFCVVLHIDRSMTAGLLSASSDVVPTATLSGIATDSSSQPLAIVYFGISFAPINVQNAQPAMNVWMDDVIIHHAPVTCAD